MKNLLLTRHCIDRYAIRTGRQNPWLNLETFLNCIQNARELTYTETVAAGFSITRIFKGDTYHLWYDEFVNDELLAVVAKDGAVKTILRREIYDYKYKKGCKEHSNLKGRSFIYEHEQEKRHKRRTTH